MKKSKTTWIHRPPLDIEAERLIRRCRIKWKKSTFNTHVLEWVVMEMGRKVNECNLTSCRVSVSVFFSRRRFVKVAYWMAGDLTAWRNEWKKHLKKTLRKSKDSRRSLIKLFFHFLKWYPSCWTFWRDKIIIAIVFHTNLPNHNLFYFIQLSHLIKTNWKTF